MVFSTYKGELRRLQIGPSDNELPGGIGTVRFIATCDGNAGEVLDRARQVLSDLLELVATGWPSLDQFAEQLPSWFVQQCERANGDEHLLSEEDSPQKYQPWSLEGWVGWFNPNDIDGREWRWWDALIVDENHIVLAVEVDGWPFPYGAITWLFRAAGAIDFFPEPDS